MNRRALVRVVIAVVTQMVLVVGTASSSQGQTFTDLYKFTGLPDGEQPYAGLVRDANGNLYGTTLNDGQWGCGTVFKVDTGGKESVLYSFAGHWTGDGESPYAGLIVDANGNLYGTTYYGGPDDFGTVFKVDTSGNETVLFTFGSVAGPLDGIGPYGGLVRDPDGNLYGTTYRGGQAEEGTVFKLDTSGTETVLYSFTGNDGANPYAALARDQHGNLYGTTSVGGAFSSGKVFKLTHFSGGWKESALYTFTGGIDGGSPYAGLVLDSSGNLYGTTARAGIYDAGEVFKLEPSPRGAWNITVLYNFTGQNDGGLPYSGVIFDKSGNLYGTTYTGGYYQAGTVFVLQPTVNGQWKEAVLHHFTGGADGGNPYSGVIRDSQRNLYGTTFSGGNVDYNCNPGGCGTVWKLTP